MSEPQQAPECITPSNLSQLTDEEIDQMLEGIRERRMLKLAVYKEVLALKEKAKREGLEAKLEKRLSQFAKQLESVDRALDKLEKYTNELRGLRLQLSVE